MEDFLAAIAMKDASGISAIGTEILQFDIGQIAKRELGDGSGADATLRQLLAIHASTMDSVLVVEPARQKSAVSATASTSR